MACVVRKSGLRGGTTIETFEKREKEMRRMERQRDKAANRKEDSARKNAGITSESDRHTDITENAAASNPVATQSTME